MSSTGSGGDGRRGDDGGGGRSSSDRVAHFVFKLNWMASCHGVWVRYAKILRGRSSPTTHLIGRVVEKHQKKISDGEGNDYYMYYIKVTYQVVDDDDGCHHFTRKYDVSNEAWDRTHEGSDVDLVILPGYPRSAMLSMQVQQFDPDMHPPVEEQWFLPAYYQYFVVPVFALGFSPLLEDDTAAFYWFVAKLGGGIPVLFLTIYYWQSKTLRNAKLHSMLYGVVITPSERIVSAAADHETKEEGRDPSAAVPKAVVRKRVSYDAFCPEDKLSFLGSVPVMILRWAWTSVVLAYWAVFGGMALFFTLQWNRRHHDRYRDDDGVGHAAGEVACREVNGSTIVRYEVDDRTYKKRFDSNTIFNNNPAQAVGRELDGRMIVMYEVDDSTYQNRVGRGQSFSNDATDDRYRIDAADGLGQPVELVYLKGLPRSALPVAHVTNRLKEEIETPCIRYCLVFCSFLIPGQIAAIWFYLRSYFVTSHQSGLLLAGAATGSYFILAYFGWCYQQYCFEQDARYGRLNDCIVLTGGRYQYENDDHFGDRQSTTETELTNAVSFVSEVACNGGVTIEPAVIFSSTKPNDPVTATPLMS